MNFTRYRATRDISLGQLRRTLRAGDVVEFDGTMTRVDGHEHRISTMDTIIGNKWLVPLDEVTAIAVPVSTLPATPSTEPASQKLLDTRIPFASPQARAASGARPAANQQHVWDTGSATTPGWLNNADGRTCVVCGVTELWPGNLIRVDRQRGDGSQQIHYVDAHGQSITAIEELSCPTYLGDPGSAAAYAKDQVRKVRGRVDDVEGRMVSLDDRLYQLESDNEFLKERILNLPLVNAEVLANALLILARRQESIPEQIRHLLPPPIELDAEIEASPIKVEIFHPDD